MKIELTENQIKGMIRERIMKEYMIKEEASEDIKREAMERYRRDEIDWEVQSISRDEDGWTIGEDEDGWTFQTECDFLGKPFVSNYFGVDFKTPDGIEGHFSADEYHNKV